MNRLLQHARQMHQRRTTYFYLSPTEKDYAMARFLANQLKLNLPTPSRRDADDVYEDDDDNGRPN